MREQFADKVNEWVTVVPWSTSDRKWAKKKANIVASLCSALGILPADVGEPLAISDKTLLGSCSNAYVLTPTHLFIHDDDQQGYIPVTSIEAIELDEANERLRVRGL